MMKRMREGRFIGAPEIIFVMPFDTVDSLRMKEYHLEHYTNYPHQKKLWLSDSLLYCALADFKSSDRDLCIKKFNEFYKKHQQLIADIIKTVKISAIQELRFLKQHNLAV